MLSNFLAALKASTVFSKGLINLPIGEPTAFFVASQYFLAS